MSKLNDCRWWDVKMLCAGPAGWWLLADDCFSSRCDLQWAGELVTPVNPNWNRRYKFLVLGREGPYFVKEHSDSKNKYTEDDIINMLEFLVDNIFVVFGGKVFQQIVCIPMGTNCAPLLADIFLYSYKAEFIQSLLSKISISVQLHI